MLMILNHNAQLSWNCCLFIPKIEEKENDCDNLSTVLPQMHKYYYYYGRRATWRFVRDLWQNGGKVIAIVFFFFYFWNKKAKVSTKLCVVIKGS